ncbi:MULTISPECIES: response regulator transcription factor [unclassified Isoptericola]|uniref:response regulator transcription factor n=1 Tax=unclassified Isoptericola TaxID=2623355 RepID=UPI0027129428|nr:MULTISPECIES: response regulator transcription factor [unclassified Isoptericola]MDO8145900.1 response regulator transcription factor [Isoptericola sp. 178]MDO8147751.1 response regulator transcription factor [Isoptericola sp. b515]
MTTPSSGLTVVVADDHVVFSEGLRLILDDAGFRVLATAGDSVAASALVREHQPDLAVLDVHMPGGSATALVRRIREDSPRTRIAMLSMQASQRRVAELEDLGIAAYLSKVVDAATLCSVLTAAAHSSGGGTIRVVPGALDGPDREVSLRAGDRELLAHIAAGRSNRWIAQEMYVSEATVKRRLAEVYRELGASTRAGAISRAYQLGLIQHEAGTPPSES